MKILVVEPLKKPYVDNVEDFREAAKKHINSFAEHVSLEPDVDLYCDESGKLKSLKGNRRIRYDTEYMVITGTFFICGYDSEATDDGESESVSLTEEQIAKYSKIFETIEFIIDEESEASLNGMLKVDETLNLSNDFGRFVPEDNTYYPFLEKENSDAIKANKSAGGKRNKYIRYFSYKGSKRRLLPKLELLLPRGTYDFYDACGGSGIVSLNLAPKFNKTTYNEINPHIFRLFELMKKPDKRDALIEELTLIEHSKSYFKKCLDNYIHEFKDIDSEIEKAKQTYALITLSFQNGMGSYKKKEKEKMESEESKKHKESIRINTLRNNLKAVAKALESIKIDSRDCFDLIKEECNNSSSFIYLDVPYVGFDCYHDDDNKWDLFRHLKFAELCKNAKCKIMISNFSNGIYDQVFGRYGEVLKASDKKWYKYYLGSLNKPQNKSGRDKLGVYVDDEIPKVEADFINDEYVYMNYYPNIAFAESEAPVRYFMFSNRWATGDKPIMIEGNAPTEFDFDKYSTDPDYF